MTDKFIELSDITFHVDRSPFITGHGVDWFVITNTGSVVSRIFPTVSEAEEERDRMTNALREERAGSKSL